MVTIRLMSIPKCYDTALLEVRTLHMCTAGEQADFAEEDDDEPVIRIHRKASYYLLLLLAQLFTT